MFLSWDEASRLFSINVWVHIRFVCMVSSVFYPGGRRGWHRWPGHSLSVEADRRENAMISRYVGVFFRRDVTKKLSTKPSKQNNPVSLRKVPCVKLRSDPGGAVEESAHPSTSGAPSPPLHRFHVKTAVCFLHPPPPRPRLFMSPFQRSDDSRFLARPARICIRICIRRRRAHFL